MVDTTEGACAGNTRPEVWKAAWRLGDDLHGQNMVLGARTRKEVEAEIQLERPATSLAFLRVILADKSHLSIRRVARGLGGAAGKPEKVDWEGLGRIEGLRRVE